ncbi:NADH-ubiquinone oxidoreductase 78 kDa subunit, mitochondrial [Fusarium oxysporum f. sp. lycopersici 4287]|uniref:NADH-ubiquinone oxidoreductase 78 kDa subunit, mitochondrial n=1 Tax=Fusarium oxysporum f. sp. lycopersici (strain 4287 / CBS 123668 / FGSC 9935 / NRRL 34936) TaxID=426428 RepID=A0A0J9V4R6_FUSO4|nr:NADH-ubiquinone oxidoreductase 78 kDa subunit, mitochondrial [Fusarium oxysporum f. sp. lycopersici 4287]KAI8413566.1 hypothetical protein FOFC_06847 [Fusarium oxysporum]KNB05841.1 NADH-ubiquinone oxidoreductase 78 kDa subunit, mitochondrial [Fusarium oxysporum f. sp. lycopersici 4287]
MPRHTTRPLVLSLISTLLTSELRSGRVTTSSSVRLLVLVLLRLASLLPLLRLPRPSPSSSGSLVLMR